MAQSREPMTRESHLRVMRIVVFALCMGVVMFAALIVFMKLSTQTPVPPPKTPTISIIGALGAGMMVVMSYIVPRFLVDAAARQQSAKQQRTVYTGPDAEVIPVLENMKWWALYQTQLIVSSAMLEGAAFFQIIAYQIESQPWSLAIAIALVLLLALKFPTKASVEKWILEKSQQFKMES